MLRKDDFYCVGNILHGSLNFGIEDYFHTADGDHLCLPEACVLKKMEEKMQM